MIDFLIFLPVTLIWGVVGTVLFIKRPCKAKKEKYGFSRLDITYWRSMYGWNPRVAYKDFSNIDTLGGGNHCGDSFYKAVTFLINACKKYSPKKEKDLRVLEYLYTLGDIPEINLEYFTIYYFSSKFEGEWCASLKMPNGYEHKWEHKNIFKLGQKMRSDLKSLREANICIKSQDEDLYLIDED